ATLVTEDADLICRKNGLSFDAFAHLTKMKIPFRSTQHHYALDSLSLRFVRGSSMHPLAPGEADLLLEDAAAACWWAGAGGGGVGGDGGGSGQGGVGLGGELVDGPLDQQAWYKHFRDTLSSSLHHQEHDMLDCPAVVLVVVSSTEASGDPVACFDELSSPRYLPPPFQSHQYDPHCPSLVYVLLHDWCRGAAEGVDPDRLFMQV
ncbi:unnamed protein product, partial [Discosporangium mesarthrocarpum]